MHHVAVGDLVVLAFQPQLANVARARLAAALDVIVYAMVSVQIGHTLDISAALGKAGQGLAIPNLGTIFPNMGTIAGPVSPSDALFSKVQQRVLALIFGHTERSFYTSEIVRTVRSGTGAVERELSRLEQSGLVAAEWIGNQKHYRANRNSPVFAELRGLVAKTLGVPETIRESLWPHGSTIAAAFIYGSVAKGSDTALSDVDLMVIGDELNFSELYTAAHNAEDKLRRKVNPLFLSPADWRRKSAARGSVISKIRQAPKIFIIGSEQDLTRGQARARQPRQDSQAQA
jgi:predicted nucleotidyltransferase